MREFTSDIWGKSKISSNCIRSRRSRRHTYYKIKKGSWDYLTFYTSRFHVRSAPLHQPSKCRVICQVPPEKKCPKSTKCITLNIYKPKECITASFRLAKVLELLSSTEVSAVVIFEKEKHKIRGSCSQLTSSVINLYHFRWFRWAVL